LCLTAADGSGYDIEKAEVIYWGADTQRATPFEQHSPGSRATNV
jgi:hypothetical protein